MAGTGLDHILLYQIMTGLHLDHPALSNNGWHTVGQYNSIKYLLATLGPSCSINKWLAHSWTIPLYQIFASYTWTIMLYQIMASTPLDHTPL